MITMLTSGIYLSLFLLKNMAVEYLSRLFSSMSLNQNKFEIKFILELEFWLFLYSSNV